MDIDIASLYSSVAKWEDVVAKNLENFERTASNISQDSAKIREKIRAADIATNDSSCIINLPPLNVATSQSTETSNSEKKNTKSG